MPKGRSDDRHRRHNLHSLLHPVVRRERFDLFVVAVLVAVVVVVADVVVMVVVVVVESPTVGVEHSLHPPTDEYCFLPCVQQ